MPTFVIKVLPFLGSGHIWKDSIFRGLYNGILLVHEIELIDWKIVNDYTTIDQTFVVFVVILDYS